MFPEMVTIAAVSESFLSGSLPDNVISMDVFWPVIAD
jgi:hypothetical protein